LAPSAGIIIAAPASGSGKTAVTLGLLRLLTQRGQVVTSAKVGPDYIDPAFHAAASGRTCLNLDGWAMRPATLGGLVTRLGAQAPLILCEGVMGLFDGAFVPVGEPDGSTAQLAAATGWPVVMVIDGRGMTGSAAAVLAGFARLRPDVAVKGVLFNKVMGDKHKAAIRAACAIHCPDVALLGFLPPDAALDIPSRHLGLVQAVEQPDLQGFLDGAARFVGAHVDVEALVGLARPSALESPDDSVPVPPLGQRIAVADDVAFAFRYPAVLEGWRRMGAEILPFSPLAGQGPAAHADAVYLPGGYPELHAGALAAHEHMLAALRRLAGQGAAILGECGGYMLLGQTLEDAHGHTHVMAGLLNLGTSFARRRLHLGYRRAELVEGGVLGAAGAGFRGHEFHYATITREQGDPLFRVADAQGNDLGTAGLRAGKVAGSFIHLIDRTA
jgi:cobyrinic acid a,c-diamide synthase